VNEFPNIVRHSALRRKFDVNADGFESRTAWDGVLYYDPDGTGEITEMRQYVFTEWDPTAASDMEAQASVFDTNGDGELAGTESDDFRLLVKNSDDVVAVPTLVKLGVTSIKPTAEVVCANLVPC